jgi:hypothetical protein
MNAGISIHTRYLKVQQFETEEVSELSLGIFEYEVREMRKTQQR